MSRTPSKKVIESPRLSEEEEASRHAQLQRAAREEKVITDAFVCVRERLGGRGLKYDGVVYRSGEIMPTFGNHRNDHKLLDLGQVRYISSRDHKGLLDSIYQSGRQVRDEDERLEREMRREN